MKQMDQPKDEGSPMDDKERISEKLDIESGIDLFRKLIVDHEEWLMERILGYAKTRDYVQFTSTLREAWRLSISGLSSALLAVMRADPPNLEMGPDDAFVGDPIAEFGVIEARLHRERGVNLGMFLGLMKYYRQSYKDLVRHAGFNSLLEAYCLNLVERFFDRIEIAFCIEWAKSDQSELIEELQTRNRLMTNEKNRYLTIFESHPHMVFILDKDLHLLNLNHAAALRFQQQWTPGAHYYDPASKTRQDQFRFGNTSPSGPEDFAVKALQTVVPSLADELKLFIGGGNTNVSFEKETMDHGERRYFTVTLSQVLDVSEKFSGVILVLEDITEKKQATEELRRTKEKADAANRAKSTFLANMSHELRTPMNAVLGYTQLMLKDLSLKPEHREYLNTINRSGEHLLALINDVLEISRIEAGRITLTPVTFDLYELLRDLEIMFRVRTDAKGLQFEVVQPGELTRYVVGDENKLRQILINLLGNAVKFTEEGGIALRVALTNEFERGMYLMVEVEDTGPGIAEEEMEAVFGYFEQTAAGKKEQNGSGLGMAISRNFARMMGGDITVTSRIGFGSTFHFRMAISEGKESDSREKTREPNVICLKPGQTVPRVLVVDDKEENRVLLVKLLELAGFDVRDADNGEKAVALFEKYSPDFIWMDVCMPVMDGLEATRRIRAMPAGQKVKIAALTASVMDEERNLVLASGCDAFVRKPCRELRLFEVMADHLGVTYRHGERCNEVPDGLQTDSLSSKSLEAVLPEAIRQELLKAVLELDTARTLELAEKATQYNAEVATLLKKLAEDLDYNRLLTLLER
jgi:signal transduction histidine kinase/DNA-binding response OmpR family regulator